MDIMLDDRKQKEIIKKRREDFEQDSGHDSDRVKGDALDDE